MSFITAFATGKIVAGLVAGGALAAGGTVAAAYTGNLPAPLQQTAHDVLGAPAAPQAAKAPDHDASGDPNGAGPTPGDSKNGKNAENGKNKESNSKATPKPHAGGKSVGPDATGPAAWGLCTAFSSGGLDPSSTAYKSLAAAAAEKGSADIASYCKTVPAPGKSGEAKSGEAKSGEAKSGEGNSGEGKSDEPRKSDNQGKSGEHRRDGGSGSSSTPGSTAKPTTPGQSNRGLSQKSSTAEAS